MYIIVYATYYVSCNTHSIQHTIEICKATACDKGKLDLASLQQAVRTNGFLVASCKRRPETATMNVTDVPDVLLAKDRFSDARGLRFEPRWAGYGQINPKSLEG